MIDLEIDGRVAVVTLNRPEKANALSAAGIRELAEAWTRIREDDEILAAVVAGAGDHAFCGGADLDEVLPHPFELGHMWAERFLEPQQDTAMFKPIVAAVNGPCIGGGFTVMLQADIRLVTPTASFGLPEVDWGLPPGNGGTQRLPAQLPHAIAMEMVLTGEPIDAEAAFRWGLVNRIVPFERLMDEALAVARSLAAKPPLALRGAKELVLRSRDVPLSAGLAMEQGVIRLVWGGEDAKEALSAYHDGRAPRFAGR